MRIINLMLILCVLTTHTGVAHGGEASTVEAMTTLLQPTEVQVLVLPRAIFKKIKKPTALFYFAPTCPHCQDVMKDVNRLAAQGDLHWIGISSSRSTSAQLKTFKSDYKPAFEILKDDEDSSFSRAVDARSTPSIYVVRPRSEPADDDARNTVDLTDVYTPFSRSMAGLMAIRSRPDSPFHDFEHFQGPQVCGSCHVTEIRSWAMTHHAAAYLTLYTRKRAEDAACVGCHVTGMGQPGGFVTGDHGSPMRDVGCEACHGPGGPHNGQTEAPSVDPKATCVACHDADHSIAFSVEKGLPHIDHFAAAGLSDAVLREKIQAIRKGEAPKPLLAFPEGPTAGAQACLNCHKETHSSWTASPHAASMNRLGLEQKADPSCVRCHATPRTFGGTEPTAVAGFRVDEGVGCESCHGAGTAHIQDPKKDNIVGLGESCPECVIEAICTSCHTPRWDPGWALEDRLKATEH
jgi:thiol-disulfide isomerase/thioredoxin